MPKPLPPATLGGHYVRHLRNTAWWRSKTADKVSQQWRPAAHLVFGALKVTSYALAGLGVGAYEGTRRAAPHVRRAGQSKFRRKHGHLIADARSAHSVRCCGQLHTSIEAQRAHQKTHHVTKPARATRKSSRKPASRRPPGRRAPQDYRGHAHQTITQRGRDIMSDATTDASKLSTVFADIGENIPRGLQDLMDNCSALRVAFGVGSEHMEEHARMLATTLNIDPLISQEFLKIAELMAEIARGYDAAIGTTLHVYQSAIDLARSGVTVPSEDVLAN